MQTLLKPEVREFSCKLMMRPVTIDNVAYRELYFTDLESKSKFGIQTKACGRLIEADSYIMELVDEAAKGQDIVARYPVGFCIDAKTREKYVILDIPAFGSIVTAPLYGNKPIYVKGVEYSCLRTFVFQDEYAPVTMYEFGELLRKCTDSSVLLNYLQ